MVDSRALNAVTSVSSFNFKSGDISGTAAKMTDEKMGQGGEYFQMEEQPQQTVPQGEMYVDRSAQLRATLNSLAMMNVANMLANKKRRQQVIDEEIAQNTEIDEHFEDIQLEEDIPIEDFLTDFDDE